MFIGREKELAKLQSIANALSNHKGAAVFLHGELGIGKTSLLRAFKDNASDQGELIYCRCSDSIFSDELTPVFDFARTRSREIAELIDNNADINDLFPLLLEFFTKRQKSILLVIEDAQWTNGMMLSFLRYFGRRLVFSRCMLVISYRTSELTPEHKLQGILDSIPKRLTHEIQLNPLSRETLDQLCYAKNELEKLHQVTGGNPLFITQLKFSDKDAFSERLSIEDIIRARINKLDDDQRDLLETLSVIPYPISLTLIRKLNVHNSNLEYLIEEDGGFLITDLLGCYLFQHELVRRITLERVSEIRQVSFHATILNAYNELGEHLNPVWKLLHAHGSGNAREAVKFSLELAEASSQISAHNEAAAYLSVGLNYAYTADNETAAILYESWAREASFSPDVIDKLFDFRQHAINLWKALGREDKIGENLYALSRAHWLNGDPAQARLLADQAIDVLENTSTTNQIASAYSLRSQLSLTQGEFTDSITFGNKALQLEKLSGDYVVRTHALNNVGSSMMLSGARGGQELLQESLDLALKYRLHEHISRGYVNIASCALHLKDLATAERVISQGITYGTMHENESKSSYLHGLLAQVRAEQGKLIDAKTIASGLLKSDEKTLIVLMPARNVLARTYSLTADPAAEQDLKQVLSKSLSIGEPQYTTAARLNLIEYAWIVDKRELAVEQIKKLSELEPSKLENWRSAELACWASRFQCDIQTLSEHAAPLPYKLELSGDLKQAAEEWRRLGMPLNQGICLMLNRSEAPAEDLLAAYKLFESCGAHGLLGKLRTEAKKLGLQSVIPKRRRGRNKDSRQHPLGLTKKEQQVLHQVLDGKSNIEISHDLSRSKRTIEAHVSSLLMKFNVRNRLEVILRVQNEPWLSP